MQRRMQVAIAGVLMAALVLPLASMAAEQSIVFVDLDRAFTDFYKTKLADAQLKEQGDEFTEERRQLMEEFEALQEEFDDLRDESQNTALSESARAEKRDLAEEKLLELRDFESRIRRFDESRRKQLEDQSRRMRKRIVDEILQVVENHARVEGYDAVLDSSGQSMNGVNSAVFVDPKVDITDQVLDILNKGRLDEEE